MQAVARDLGGTTTEAYWVGVSYLLTSSVFQPFIGGLSDIFGRQPTLLCSLLFFTLGTAVACAAKDFTGLLTGRCVQGIGGGGIIAMSLVIFTDIVPLRYRPKWYGIVQGAWAIGTILGPLIGGLIAQHTTWRWIFYINFPLCGIGISMVSFVARLKMTETTFKDKIIRVDWIGGFVFIASTTSFLIAISWGGIQEPWDSFRTLTPLILGVIGTALALLWEYKFAIQPFLRRTLFSSLSSTAAYCAAVVQGAIVCLYFPFPRCRPTSPEVAY
jgi:MFS family permease